MKTNLKVFFSSMAALTAMNALAQTVQPNDGPSNQTPPPVSFASVDPFEVCMDKYEDNADSDGYVIDRANADVNASKMRQFEDGLLIAAEFPVGPIAISTEVLIRNSLGRFGLNLSDSGSKTRKRMLKYARSLQPDLTEESFDALIEKGFATEFCSKKILAGPVGVRKFIANELQNSSSK